MEDYKNVQGLLENLEREIIDLKTSHSVSPVVGTFYASITPSSTSPITITYEDGANAIITDIYSDATAILGTVSSNTQTIYFSSQAATKLTVVSTRPILSITQ